MTEIDTPEIRRLNDRLRKHTIDGIIIFAGDFGQSEHEQRNKVLRAVMTFDDFSEDNDPYSEHDFGAFTLDGEDYMFKIDYYNLTMDGGSENPADASITKRVLSIFFARDY